MARRGQTATEYLIILGVVIVLALVVVFVLGGFPSFGPRSERHASQIYWSSTDIAVDDLVMDASGGFVFLRNNRPDMVTITDITVDGQSLDIEEKILDIGAEKKFESSAISCSTPGESLSNELTITYTEESTGATRVLTGKQPYIGTCAEDISRIHDWLMLDFDMQNSGVSPAGGPLTNESMEIYDVAPGAIETQVLVEGNRIYAATFGGMTAYDLTTGELWSDDDGGWTVPIITGSVICYAGVNLYCRDKLTGRGYWEAEPPTGEWFDFTQISLVDGHLWLGQTDLPTVNVYNVTDGTLLYQENLTGSYTPGTASDGDSVYVNVLGATTSYDVIAYDATDFTKEWQVDFDDLESGDNNCIAEGAPLIHEDTLYVALSDCDSKKRPLVALDKDTGALKWLANQTESVDIYPSFVSPVIWEGVVLVTSYNLPAVFGYNASSGERLWRTNLSSNSWAANPVVGGGVAYVASTDGVMHALNVSDGSIIWKATLPDSGGTWTSASLARGKLYVGSESGKVYVFS